MAELCPSVEQLRRHAIGANSDQLSVILQRHVDGCLDCQARIGELTRDFDRLLSGLPDTARRSLLTPHMGLHETSPQTIIVDVAPARPSTQAASIKTERSVDALLRPPPAANAADLAREHAGGSRRFVLLLVAVAAACAWIPFAIECIQRNVALPDSASQAVTGNSTSARFSRGR